MTFRLTSVMRAAVLLGCLTTIGCVEKAALPPVRQAVDPLSRTQIYADYKLTYDRGVFSETWKRRDGEHNLAELNDVLDAYPQTQELKAKIEGRRIVIGTIGGVGAGLISGTLVYNLTAPEGDRMASGTQVALYVTGGALLLTGIVLNAAWRDPAWDLADTYNRALSTDLGNPGGPLPPRSVRRAIDKPRFVLAPVPMVGPQGSIAAGLAGGMTF